MSNLLFDAEKTAEPRPSGPAGGPAGGPACRTGRRGAGFTREALEELSEALKEPEWVREERRQAWRVFEALPDLSGFPFHEMTPFLPPPEKAAPESEWPSALRRVLEERGDEEGLMIQRDSTVLSSAITKEQAKRGVIFCDLETAVREYAHQVRPYWHQLVKPGEGKWTALHAAFWSGGTFLYVPRHVEVELPFHTAYWLSTAKASIFPHTLIVAEPYSKVTLVEDYMSPPWSESSLACGALEIFSKGHAQVHYLGLQHWGPSVVSSFTQRALLAPKARLEFTISDARGTHLRTWSSSDVEQRVDLGRSDARS